MALALEAGSEQYAPLARAIIGGLMVSFVVTLFLVPAAYYLMHRSEEKQTGGASLRRTILWLVNCSFAEPGIVGGARHVDHSAGQSAGSNRERLQLKRSHKQALRRPRHRNRRPLDSRKCSCRPPARSYA